MPALGGVQYSPENPYTYEDSNIAGFLNIIVDCRKSDVKHIVYASSPSVYGMNTKQPHSTYDRVDYHVLFILPKRDRMS